MTRRPAPPARLRFIRASQGEYVHQIAIGDDSHSIVELAKQLDPEQFWQVHRATLINLNYLTDTRRDERSRLFLHIKRHASELRVNRPYVHLFKAM